MIKKNTIPHKHLRQCKCLCKHGIVYVTTAKSSKLCEECRHKVTTSKNRTEERKQHGIK